MGNWWIPSSISGLELAESALLGSVSTPMRVYNTPISGDMHIHAIEAGERKDAAAPLVLCHGYGLGAACYVSTIASLSRQFQVFATDWIGCGNSSRPRWEKTGVEENENFFVQCLEEWRAANNIDRMVLCGHSLGGYLSVAYAEQHPERIEKLILASPAGVPDHPPEFLTRGIDGMPARRRALFKTATWLWGQGYTPGDIIRFSGPYGKRLVAGYADHRLGGTEERRKLLGDFIYHNIAATHGSGDKALPHLLQPGAFAVKPLIKRIGHLDPRIQVFFVYGDHDWMDYRNGIAVQRRLRLEELQQANGNSGSKKLDKKQQQERQRVEVLVVKDAGHQLFLDNPAGFDEALEAIIRAPTSGWYRGITPTALVSDAGLTTAAPPVDERAEKLEPDVEAVAAPGP